MIELASDAVPTGTVVPVEVDGGDYVLWRGRDGQLGSAPRWCPHLDWDLADARVDGGELVCAGHGWSFDCDGHAFKRTELGRIDPKDDIPTLDLSETDGVITAGSASPAR
jgi:phenylpropionate dioxygenase-like ring-hydroxylating dioxygenase large terminal subunit